MLELHLAGHDVHAILPTGYGKSQIYQLFCLAKPFTSNPNVSMLVILLLKTRSTASSKKNQIFHLKPDIHLKLSTAMGKNVTTAGLSPVGMLKYKINCRLNSAFENFAITFRFKPTDMAKMLLPLPSSTVLIA